MSDTLVYLLVILVSVLLIRIAVVAARYTRDIRAARKRIDSLGSQIIETKCGPVEFALVGEDYPILVVHGALGGFDQGLFLARSIDVPNSQIISVSRFGFLRSPVPPGATLDTQADAYAALLDALEIRRAAVFAVSAGSTSAIRFAARHPERVSALILLGPDAPGEPYMALPPRFMSKYPVRQRFCVLGDEQRFRKEDANRNRPGAQGIHAHPGLCGPGHQGPDRQPARQPADGRMEF